MLDIVACKVNAFLALGGTFLASAAQAFYATQRRNLYISDRLSWDLDADLDLLLEEYFTRFYGPAAEPQSTSSGSGPGRCRGQGNPGRHGQRDCEFVEKGAEIYAKT